MTHPDVLPDVARRAWAPVTVRVAWTLRTLGITVRPEVLRDARDHVWFHLDPATPTSVACDRAEALTADFVARANGEQPLRRWSDDLEQALPPRWRARFHHGLSNRAAWVLRVHYADGAPLADIAERLGEDDTLALEAAREGLREIVRRVAHEDGISLEGWPDDRLDQFCRRLATMSADGAPPLLEVSDGLHPEWLDRCVTCTRAYTLVRLGLLQRGDLVPPKHDPRPADVVTVVALHIHPSVRHKRKQIARSTPGLAIPLGDDLLLLPGEDLGAALQPLRRALELGRIDKRHIRGSVLRGEGRWSKHGLVGPLVAQVDPRVRGETWGQVGGAELPDRLARPPSAWPNWLGAGALLAAAVWLGQAATASPSTPDPFGLQVQASEGRQGLWVSFDVHEDALVFVARERNGHIDVVLDAHRPADKIAHATGDGSYRLHAVGDAVLVAASREHLGDVETWIDEANAGGQPLSRLARRLSDQAVDSTVWVHPNTP